MADPLERRVYGAHWRKVRLVVLERDGWICQIRGAGCTLDATQVDHIIPWRAGGSWYDPENLRASCARCNNARAERKVKRRPSREW